MVSNINYPSLDLSTIPSICMWYDFNDTSTLTLTAYDPNYERIITTITDKINGFVATTVSGSIVRSLALQNGAVFNTGAMAIDLNAVSVLTSQSTIAIVMVATAPSGVGTFISYSDFSVPSTEFAMRMIRGEFVATARNNGAGLLASGNNWSTGKFHANNDEIRLMIYIADGSQSRFITKYKKVDFFTVVDANSVSFNSISPSPGNRSLLIGANRDKGGYQWKSTGHMYELALFSSLSDIELENIITHYTGKYGL